MGVVENIQHAELLRAVPVVNGCCSEGRSEKGSLEKRSLENGDSSLAILQYKRRKFSVFRDFPPGCGPLAPQMPKEALVCVGGNGKLAVGEKSGDVLVGDDVKVLGTAVEPESPKELAKSIPTEMPNPLNESDSKVEMTVICSGLTHGIELKHDKPVKMEPLPPNEPVNAPDVVKNEKYLPQRKISAIRDFPPFCGRYASCLSEEEHLKALVHLKNKSLGWKKERVNIDGKQTGGDVQDRDVLQGVNVKAEELSEWKVGKGIVTYSNDENLEKKFPSLLGSVKEGPAGLGDELLKDRVIVQCLTAAKNCPWSQGKVGPNQAGSMSGRRGKDSSTVQETFKSIIKGKNDKMKKLGAKSRKKTLSHAANAVYQDMGQLVVRDAEDSLEHHEEQEDFHGSQRVLDFDVSLPPFGASSSRGKVEASDSVVTRNKVRETLRLFQAIFRKLLQEEEAKSKQGGNSLKRVDYLASRILKDKGKHVNTGKQIIGPVPGVEVGDEFQYRVELGIIGLHRQIQGGIDYVKHHGQILATSIVASGGYADDLDNSDVLIYSGQGGNLTGGDKQPEDQKLERGNLALKNSVDAKNPVRVIRGFKETKASDYLDARAKLVTTYTYDGLYLVEKYWQEIGPHGKLMFKFQLNRIAGQPELAWKEVKKSKKFKREGICVDDISMGKESIPIFAVNTIDDEKPPPFKYITSMIYPDWCQRLPPNGCDCSDGCLDSEKCSCAVKNGGEIPYNYNGAIVEAKPLVYECGPSCKCPRSCHNRVSQHGIKFQLEIFKTVSRGWGVRSLTSIPSGSFICEYIGELLEDKEAEERTGNDEYLFDIGHNYNDHSLWDGFSKLMPDAQSNSCDVVEDGGFTIDAAQYGNVGRFINHSCSPNLYAQNVLYDHDDKRIPHIMLFAAENIPPLQELTYHYNYTIDQVLDSDGNIKKKSCYCGSDGCTGRMY